MARRRIRSDDLAGTLAQVGGLLMLLGLISPQVRQIMLAICFVGICAFGLIVVGVIGFGAYRHATRSHRSEILESTVASELPRPVLVAPNKERSTPQTTSSLLEKLRTIDWFQFEKLVGLLYRKQGYSVSRHGGANPDGGVDLIIEKDGQRAAVQCKHWKTWKVGVQQVREFLGALTDSRISNGILITFSRYTEEAERLAEKHGIEILDGDDLLRMFEGVNGGSDWELLAILKDTRKICPKCEREMVLRIAERGRNVGKQFWGCSRYPRCKFTMPVTG